MCFPEWLYDDPQTHVFINIFIPRMLMLAGAALVVIGILIGILDFCNTASCPIRTEGVLDILGGEVKNINPLLIRFRLFFG